MIGIISLNPEYVFPIKGVLLIGKFKFAIIGIIIPTNHDILSIVIIKIVPTFLYF